MSWPTGDNISGRTVVMQFLVPDTDWIQQSLLGALYGLMTEFSWDAVGTVDPTVIADLYQKIIFGVRVNPVTVGSIWWFPNDNMQFNNQVSTDGPSQFLHADGSDLSVVSYPELYAIVGNLYGGDTTHFFLPDIRSVTVIGSGQQSPYSNRILGDTIGEDSHTLTGSEVPNHAHTYNDQAITPVVAAPGVVPVTVTAPFPNITSSSGGGGDHNNMQPSTVLVPYIQAFP